MATPTRHRPQFAQRVRRVRAVVVGSADRPRLAVFLGGKSTAVQLIDDTTGRTLASASDRGSDRPATVASAAQVGTRIADAARTHQITVAVLDRRGRRYHGRVKAIADAARAAGLTI